MRFRRNTPLLGLSVALLVLATIGTVGYRTVRSQAETAEWVEHTYRVIEQVDRISMSINLAESAARGYALTREEHLRREVDPAIKVARGAFASARELTADSPKQQVRLKLLDTKLERCIELLEEYMWRVGSNGSTRVLPEALGVSSEIRALASEAVNHEQMLLAKRVDERAEQTTLTLWVLAIGLLSSLNVLLAAFGLVHREMRSRRRTSASFAANTPRPRCSCSSASSSRRRAIWTKPATSAASTRHSTSIDGRAAGVSGERHAFELARARPRTLRRTRRSAKVATASSSRLERGRLARSARASDSRRMAQVLWRRVDVAGRDACRLVEAASGYTLEGGAAFFEAGRIQCLQYRVRCDRAWRKQEARVTGWIGAQAVDYELKQTAAGVWTLNGREYPQLNECADLDVGFTPATHLIQMRRVALAEGQAADVPAAWLDVEAGTLTFLPQRYARQSATQYHYASPTASYEAVLEVTPVGFVRTYPGLWELEHMHEGASHD